MNDLKEKLDERWKTKRNKAFNWTKIIIMTAVLIVIIVVMMKLSSVDNIKWDQQTPRTQETPRDTLGTTP
ncbi:MAG TPA: hypothetical protein PL124_00515 [Candidatus Cloacimonadota bacterium]|nr:hypothetical protein [Candidatus Cloacimonadota bacterium]HPS37874.1 hypothetical protein [Candidatus Cloacimonadota bacterium]